MPPSIEMTTVLKRTAKLFIFFCGAVVLTAALAYILDIAGTGFEKNFAFWALVVLLWPSVMIRRGLDDAPQEGYIYISSIGVPDIIGLAFLYFLACFLLTWLWSTLKKRAIGANEA